jgi:outer membrane protein OmpA-like peptidoglycan-associated protein
MGTRYWSQTMVKSLPLSNAFVLVTFTFLLTHCAPSGGSGDAAPPVQPVLIQSPNDSSSAANPAAIPTANPADAVTAGSMTDGNLSNSEKGYPSSSTQSPPQQDQNSGKNQGEKQTLPASQEPTELMAIVHFDFDRSIIRPEDQILLDHLLENLNGREISKIRITGHADRIGTDSYNLRLSRRRAEVVARYLLQRSRNLLTQPIQPVLMEIIAKGESEPITTRCPSDGSRADEIQCLAPDRRTEVSVSVNFSGVALTYN